MLTVKLSVIQHNVVAREDTKEIHLLDVVKFLKTQRMSTLVTHHLVHQMPSAQFIEMLLNVHAFHHIKEIHIKLDVDLNVFLARTVHQVLLALIIIVEILAQEFAVKMLNVL